MQPGIFAFDSEISYSKEMSNCTISNWWNQVDIERFTYVYLEVLLLMQVLGFFSFPALSACVVSYPPLPLCLFPHQVWMATSPCLT